MTGVCTRHVDCGHCGRGRSDNNSHGHDVCQNKTGCQLSQFANTCAARANETARPHATVKYRKDNAVCHHKIERKTVRFADTCAARATKTARPLATVINSNNNNVCSNTVYCRGIFTDDEDEGNEIVFSQTIKQTIGSYTEPGVSLDDKISSYNAPSRALYESHTHYRGSDPRSVTAVNREAPSSGSSGNLGQGPWDERHLSSVGLALGPEGHYADTATATAYDYTDTRSERGTAVTHTGAQAISHSTGTVSYTHLTLPTKRIV